MKGSLQTKARMGKIAYANCLPFYYGWTQEKADFFESNPAQVNQAIHAGEIDLAPISSLEYLMHQEDYFLLPNLAIGARKFSGSVLLLSREKIENLNGQKILLTEQSLSSSTLLKILFKERFQFENSYEVVASDPNQMLNQAKAALVIGNDALFFEPEEMVYKYDLAQLWWNWVGKPFCFALWVARRDYVENNHEEALALWKQLEEAKRKNLQDVEALIQEGLGVSASDSKHPKLLGYLLNLQYDLDSEMKEGLNQYFDFAHRGGFAPAPKPLRFLGGEN